MKDDRAEPRWPPDQQRQHRPRRRTPLSAGAGVKHSGPFASSAPQIRWQTAGRRASGTRFPSIRVPPELLRVHWEFEASHLGAAISARRPATARRNSE